MFSGTFLGDLKCSFEFIASYQVARVGFELKDTKT
jgi:hypothetical protein